MLTQSIENIENEFLRKIHLQSINGILRDSANGSIILNTQQGQFFPESRSFDRKFESMEIGQLNFKKYAQIQQNSLVDFTRN